MGRSIALPGIHPWKKGEINWLEVHDGDIRSIIYEPTREQIASWCTEHDFDLGKTMAIIDARSPDTHGILFEAERWRKHCNE